MNKRVVSAVLAMVLALFALSAYADFADGQIVLVNEQADFSEDSAMFAGDPEKLVYPCVWTEGLNGEGVDFAGLKTHLRFDGALITGAKALTLSVWINWRGPGLRDAESLNETGGGVLIFGLSGASGHLKVVALDNEKGDVVTFAGGKYNEDVYVLTDKALPVGEWTMVTAVIDGERMIVYINGEEAASAPQAVTPDMLYIDLFRIGSSFWGPPSLNAVVDDAYAWARALDAEEIAALYAATKAD